jgi:hypothetical protein
MARIPIPPPPDPSNKDPAALAGWYVRIKDVINSLKNSITWALLDFTGSNITDILTRNHNDLQNIQGGSVTEKYHLTAAQSNLVNSAVQPGDDVLFGTLTVDESFGYGTTSGVGGTVTQLTSKSTGVTLNKICGQITTHNASLGSGDSVAFRVTNSLVDDTDVILLSLASGGTAAAYDYGVDKVGSGYFDIYIFNYSGGGALAESLVLNFIVVKSVNS